MASVNSHEQQNPSRIEPGAYTSEIAPSAARHRRFDSVSAISAARDRWLDSASPISALRDHPLPSPPPRGEGAYSAPLDAEGAIYTFALGPYDPTRPLIIDPLLKSTYLGTSASDDGLAIAVHPHTGDVYVAGKTNAAAFPGVTGGFDDAYGDAIDAFVTRLSSDLTRVIQSTYLGGSDTDSASALAIHPASGDIYVAGYTFSSDFPMGTGSPAQNTLAGRSDFFVSHFSADLKTLRRSTYWGGSTIDNALALAIHPLSGDVYVAGSTESSNFPVSEGAVQPTFGGGGNRPSDGFVTRFSANLGSRLQSSFLGGNGNEQVNAMAIHPASGDVYMVGSTESANFPGAGVASAQLVKNGSNDAFVTRFNRELTMLRASTYLGGGQFDYGYALAVHPHSGEIIVTGSTYLSASVFPGLAGGAQSTQAGDYDAFLSRLSPSLGAVLQSTLLGGSGSDSAYGVAVNATTGEIFVSGDTESANFLTPADGFQTALVGTADQFVARYSADLTRRQQASFLGGILSDTNRALALHPASGDAYVLGRASAADFPGSTSGSPTSYGGGGDAIVSRISADLAASPRIPGPMSFIPQSNVAPGSLRTSNEVRMVITPTPPSNQRVEVVGAAGSQMCVTTQPGCCELPNPTTCTPGFATGWTTAWDTLSGDYITVRHNAASPGGTAVTKLITAGVAFPFQTSTGNANIACNLDMNGDNVLSATVEGLILVRAMLGFGADAIVAGTGLFPWDPIRLRLNEFCGTTFPFSPSAFQ